MAIKLDIGKAYGRIELNHLKGFINLDFSKNMINWIMERTMTTCFSVLVNGIPGEPFRPERDIRQVILFLYIFYYLY